MEENQILFGAKELYAKIEARSEALGDLIEQKKRELSKNSGKIPEGSIYAVLNGKKHTREQYYFRSSVSEEKSRKYIRKTEKNMDMIQKMIQREYDKKILKVAGEEYRCLKKAGQIISGDPLESVYKSMGILKQKWIKPVFPSDEDFVREWKKKTLPGPSYKKEYQLFSTKGKEFVRSKSEALIANALYDHQIPYCYEHPLWEGDRIWVLPDFTVLNVRLRKEYYWEHFGMMGEKDYSNNAVRKIREYEKHDMFQGSDVIFTFESSETLIDLDIIENMIRKYLL